MKGLEIAERYYFEVVRPMLAERFPALLPRLAAGLAGEGSECFGFDDAVSRDHDFGPGVCLWLTGADYASCGAALQAAYDGLPGGFMGFEKRQDGPYAGKRVGVFSVNEWYACFIGTELPPASPDRWLRLREERLAACTNGKIFEDGSGAFTALRNALRYYPEPVRIRRIAAAASGMGQSGQYNFARCMQRGETVAAALAKAEFLKEAMQLMYLIHKAYAPYYKWAFRGLTEQPLLQEVHPLLKQLAELPVLPATAEESIALTERISAFAIDALRRQGLTEGRSDFLVDHLPFIAAAGKRAAEEYSRKESRV